MREEDYPKRVTLGEDGIYRWTYDMDMRHNLFTFWFAMKLMLWIGLGIGLVLFVMLIGSGIGGAVWVSLAFPAMMCLVWLIAYGVWGLCAGWKIRYRFAMNEAGAVFVEAEREKKRNKILAAAVGILGLASRNPVQAISAGIYLGTGGSRPPTEFSDVRRMREHRKNDAIVLNTVLIAGLQIFVPPEDYDFVLGFLSQHVPDKALQKPTGAWVRRLGMAGLASLLVNAAAFAVNLLSFRRDQSLPLSVTFPAGGAVEQRAFGMRVYRFLSPEAALEGGEVTFYYDAALGIIGFLLVALMFFLIFSLIAWMRQRSKSK